MTIELEGLSKMGLTFTKMHGLGNDFVVINALSNPAEFTTSQIQNMACRNTGIGFDQLLIIQPPQNPNAVCYFSIYNADGSTAIQCGNGIRCIARYCVDNAIINMEKDSNCSQNEFIVENPSGLFPVIVDGDIVTVDMGSTQRQITSEPLISLDPGSRAYGTVTANSNTASTTWSGMTAEEKSVFSQATVDPGSRPSELLTTNSITALTTWSGMTTVDDNIYLIDMGNPHGIIFVDDIEESMNKYQQGELSYPDLNIGLVKIINKNTIELQTIERGVGPTLACGSNACAVVLVGQYLDLLDSKVTVKLAKGNLTIGINQLNLLLKGKASYSYMGQLY